METTLAFSSEGPMEIKLYLIWILLGLKLIPADWFSGNFSSYLLLFEPTSLFIFKKISNFPGFSYTQMKIFHPSRC